MRWSHFLFLCAALAALALTFEWAKGDPDPFACFGPGRYDAMRDGRTCDDKPYQGPDEGEWYKSLFIPDADGLHSCCGEADAYYADKTDIGPNGELVAIITDERPDKRSAGGTFINRRPVQIGTRITVPPSKIRKVPSYNPTGHTIIFLSSTLSVYCYEPQPLM